MKKDVQKQSVAPLKLSGIEVTSDVLSGRGGLALFTRFLDRVGMWDDLERLFGGIRKSAKGTGVSEMFKQVFCFLLDGTSSHLVHFDDLQRDPGYAATIETAPEDLVSSHAVKRFFRGFSGYRSWLFRQVLQRLFIWRLKLSQPEVIELGIDTMVMDNDDAGLREGVKPTYKGIKGFQPLQLVWNRFVVDAVFRSGNKHSNHGNTVAQMVRHVVHLIRSRYRAEVPIVLRADGGFLDQELFALFEELGIGYICGGKLYQDLKDYAGAQSAEAWERYQNPDQLWYFVEFGNRRGTWSRFRRAFYCRPAQQGRQLLLEFARPESVIYTNLGMGGRVDAQLRAAGKEHWLSGQQVRERYHSRGRDELVHRALKDFRSEKLPFERFSQNAAFYYTLVVGFFLYECFKEDVCRPAVALTSYPTTVRRQVIDFAAKIVRRGRQAVLKVTQATWDNLRISELWERSAAAPVFVWG